MKLLLSLLFLVVMLLSLKDPAVAYVRGGNDIYDAMECANTTTDNSKVNLDVCRVLETKYVVMDGIKMSLFTYMIILVMGFISSVVAIIIIDYYY